MNPHEVIVRFISPRKRKLDRSLPGSLCRPDLKFRTLADGQPGSDFCAAATGAVQGLPARRPLAARLRRFPQYLLPLVEQHQRRFRASLRGTRSCVFERCRTQRRTPVPSLVVKFEGRCVAHDGQARTRFPSLVEKCEARCVARDAPPIFPPRRPRATAAGSLPSSGFGGPTSSPMGICRTLCANRLVSRGMRERFCIVAQVRYNPNRN
jgi:hypothetical protein